MQGIRINWLCTAAFFVLGSVFLFASLRIPESFGGGFGHRLVPLSMSVLILVLSVWLLISNRIGGSDRPEEHDIPLAGFAKHSAPLVLLMGAYGVAHILFGFLVATFICGTAAFRLFGNSWKLSAAHGAAGSAVFYVVFFKILNVYDPPGSVIDLSGMF